MMTADTAYNFKWNLFEFHLINSHRELYKEKHFADVTLVSEDMKKFQAHKTVLGTASTVLKDLFLAKPDHKITILLKGILSQELAQILKFIYLGEAVVDVVRLDQFEKAANYLKIKNLEEMTSEMKKRQVETKQEPGITIGENTLYVGFNSDENTIYIDPSLNQNIFANLETNYGIFDQNGGSGLGTSNKADLKLNIPGSINSDDNTCNYCGKKFSRAWNLKSHVQSVHEGVKRTAKRNELAKHDNESHLKQVISSASIASMLFPVKQEGI